MSEWLTDHEILDFLKGQHLDVRVSRNGRWIDQKCTPDVLTVVADCIVQYLDRSGAEPFTSRDIWLDEYASRYVPAMFKKPNLDNERAKHEYDKFFQQPMKLLAYAGVLHEDKISARNYYTITNQELLVFIARSEQTALDFLCSFINVVLVASGLSAPFDKFLEEGTREAFDDLKDSFRDFTIRNTPINTAVECGRIFTKVLNPQAYRRNQVGTERGTLSKDIISRDMLMYNRPNFRDTRTGKPRAVPRSLHTYTVSERALVAYESQKAKRVVRNYNDAFNAGMSEVVPDGNTATQVHHIFPQSQFPSIARYFENLVALTPNQHFQLAHPDNDTTRIDRRFQRRCLLMKLRAVRDTTASPDANAIYDFKRFLEVLSVGLDDPAFLEMSEPGVVKAKIDEIYLGNGVVDD